MVGSAYLTRFSNTHKNFSFFFLHKLLQKIHFSQTHNNLCFCETCILFFSTF